MLSTKRKSKTRNAWRLLRSRVKCFLTIFAIFLLIIYILAAADIKISLGTSKVSARITPGEQYLYVIVHDMKLYTRNYSNRTVPIKLIIQIMDKTIEEVIGYSNPNGTILVKNTTKINLPRDLNTSEIFVNRDMMLYAEYPGYTPAKPYIVHCIRQNYYNVVYYAPGYLFSNITVAFTYNNIRVKIASNFSAPVSVNIVVYFANASQTSMNAYFFSKGTEEVMLFGDINDIVIDHINYLYVFTIRNLDGNSVFALRDNILVFAAFALIFASLYCLPRRRRGFLKG
ncbi:MAG: hypothetical protein LM590_08460 [Thermofilum sp.]|nr:hypothetical protein [Thermofilum sp.]